MITKILLGSEMFSSFELQDEQAISNLSKLNIFIGPNNSGKSMFLRNLFSSTDFIFHSSDFNIDKFNDSIIIVAAKLELLINSSDVLPALSVVKEKYFSNPITTSVLTDLFNFHSDLEVQRNRLQSKLSATKQSEEKERIDKALSSITALISSFSKNIKIEKKQLSNPYERHYTPILRGLRPVNFSNEDTTRKDYIDSYKYRTKSDYFNGTDLKSLNIHTGLTLFDEVEKNLLNTNINRKKVRAFEEFLSREFFNGSDISLVPVKGSDLILIGIDEVERNISCVGDGIQAIIALLYPIFMAAENHHLFFIEEPELYMHPGMQRLFLNALMKSEFSHCQYFITTHSNHFLEIADEICDVSIYSFERFISKDDSNNIVEKFRVIQKRHNDTSILDCLGVRNSSVFLSNCTIWIEGITDRKYIRKFMEIFSIEKPEWRKYKEDFHYSFVEYAGANIVHWDFDENDDSENIHAKKISNRIFLIADRDCDTNGKISCGSAKEQRYTKLENILKEGFYLTKGKEIENSLSPSVIERTLKEIEKNPALVFPENWHKANKPEAGHSYSFENLGSYIDTEILKQPEPKYTDGNTIKGKLKFCDTAIKHINSYKDLSPEAIELCEKIFSFIKTNNN